MKTLKRLPLEIDTNITNYTKYLNQMEFKGIKEDDNIYTIDQASFRDSNNIFVDWNNRLVSRQTIQRDNSLPVDVVPSPYLLTEIYDFGKGKIYVSQSPLSNEYYIKNVLVR